MWQPESQKMLPHRPSPMFGWAMTATEAALQLVKEGMITEAERRALLQWMMEGVPVDHRQSALEPILWAVWMWQMTPANWEAH